MKIAIKGHESRGKEVIQILESLGGVNVCPLKGNSTFSYYYIDYDCNNTIHCHDLKYVNKYCKKYTLEEFEKEFPFKVGDLCIYHSDTLNEDIVVKILGMTIENDCIIYEVGHKDITKKHSYIYRERETLKPYKEMKEERNITLTLDKAKEWYKKGGELKEIALQAFSEKELKEPTLPSTWNEYLITRPLFGSTKVFRCNCAKELSPRCEALIKLEYLRACYRQGWKPDWDNCNVPKWNITGYSNTEYHVTNSCFTKHFLSFQSKEIADLFYTNFKDLIKQAGDLI